MPALGSRARCGSYLEWHLPFGVTPIALITRARVPVPILNLLTYRRPPESPFQTRQTNADKIMFRKLHLVWPRKRKCFISASNVSVKILLSIVSSYISCSKIGKVAEHLSSYLSYNWYFLGVKKGKEINYIEVCLIFDRVNDMHWEKSLRSPWTERLYDSTCLHPNKRHIPSKLDWPTLAKI